MGLGEANTRAKLIDPALHSRGWTEDLIRREEMAGAIEIIEGKPTEKIWYYDLSDIKVGKKTPLTLAHFEEFFCLLSTRADSERT